jgi:hypothetical protein
MSTSPQARACRAAQPAPGSTAGRGADAVGIGPAVDTERGDTEPGDTQRGDTGAVTVGAGDRDGVTAGGIESG